MSEIPGRCESTVAVGDLTFRCEWQASSYHTVHSESFENILGERKAAWMLWETPAQDRCNYHILVNGQPVRCTKLSGHDAMHATVTTVGQEIGWL